MILEKAAKALFSQSLLSSVILHPDDRIRSDFSSSQAWEGLTPGQRRAFIEEVVAVLEAVRQPTEMMLSSGSESVKGLRSDAKQQAQAAWQAMIDTALER
jgi:hypothetical protein